MTTEPDIVRFLREKEKLGKLSSYKSVTKQEFKICESIDNHLQTEFSPSIKNENCEYKNLDKKLSESDYKVFSDLLDIINFTEKLSTNLHGNFSREEIIRIITNEFKNSNNP